jgi:hypothetical protein
MNARLGFSIAAHLDPEVLIIDEVLAVGDLAFQEKCIQRMQSFKRQGVAIVFVSHNMQAVSELCDRALYLRSSVQAEGAPADVIGAYLRLTSSQAASTSTGAIEIRAARLSGPDGGSVSSVAPATPLRLDVDYVANRPIPLASFGVRLYRSTDGLLVYDGNVGARELGIEPLEPGRPFTLHFDFQAHVTRGQYHLECVVLDPAVEVPIARLTPAGVLSVAETRSWHGIANLGLQCTA